MKKLYRKSARWLLAVLTLLCSNVMTAQTYVSTIVSGKVYRITSKANTGTALADCGGTNLVGSRGWSDICYETLWLVTTSGDAGGYTVKNLLTGRYMQGVNSDGAQATMSETEQVCFVEGTGTEGNFNILPSADGAYSFNLYGGATSTTIKGWNKGVNDTNAGSIWQFAEVTVDEDAFNFFNDKFYSKLNLNYGLVRIVMNADNKVMTDTDGRTMVEEAAVNPTERWNQVWRIQTSATGGYLLQNLGTGKYLKNNCDHDNAIETQTTSLPIYVRMSPYEEGTFNICVNNSNIETEWEALQYVQDKNYVRRWVVNWSGHGGVQSNCGFKIEFVDAEEITADQLRAQCDVLAGYATPTDGKIVRIVNNYHTNNFIVLNDAGQLQYTTSSDSYSQYWKMSSADGTNFTFRNVLTGMYLKKGTSPYTTVLHSNGTFAVAPTSPTLSVCTITDSNGNGLHASNGNVISWSTNAGASVWYFQEATLTEADWEAIRSNPTNKAVANLDAAVDFGLVRIVTDREDGKVLADVSGMVKLVTPNADDKTQLWVMTLTDGQYTFRNWSTGKYIDRATGALASIPTTTATTHTYKIVIASSSTAEKSLYSFYHPNTDANGWYYDGTSENLQIAATAGKELGAAFCIEPATDIQPIVPEAGKYYRIQNTARPGFIIVNGSNQLNKVTESEDYSQFWQIVSTSGANYTFRNAYTGQYVQKVAANATYTTGVASAEFTLEVKTGLPYYKEYYIVDENLEGLHGTESDNIIRYTTNAGASVWYFEEVTLTDEQKTAIESQPHNRLYATLNANHGLVRLYSGRTSTNVAYQSGTQMRVTAGDAVGTTTSSQIWQIVALGNGGYSIRSMNTGKYLEGYKADYAALNLVDEATTFYIKASTIGNYTDNFFISSASDYLGHTCLHDDNNGKVVGWDNTDYASTWNIVAATDADYAEVQANLVRAEVMKELPAALAHNGFVRITTDRTNGYVITDSGKDDGYQLKLAMPNEDDLNQVWIMEGSGNDYTFRNVGTGRYIDRTTEKFAELTTVATSTTQYVNGALVSTEDRPLFNISHPDAKDVCWFHRSGDNLLLTGGINATPGTAFRITAATDITVEEVVASLYAGEGWSVPETGKYYRIYNGYWSSTQGRTDEVITEGSEESNKLTTTTVTSDNKAEIWLLTSTDGTNFSFKNYSTGNYIQSQTTNVGQYATGSTEVTFSVGESANLPSNLQKWYNIVDTDGDALKMENHKVVNNSLSSETTQSNWRFKEVSTEVFGHTTDYTIDQLINDYNGIVVFRSIQSDCVSKVVAPYTDGSQLALTDRAADFTKEENYNQVWIIKRTNASTPYTYTIQNLGTGKYIGDGPSMKESAFTYYIQSSTNTTNAFNIAKNTDFSSSLNLNHHKTEKTLGFWSAYSAKNEETNSTWYIEPATGVTQEMVNEYLGIPTYTAPVSGKYYKIVSRANVGEVITAQIGGTIKAQTNENLPTQWWKLVLSDGKYSIQNAAMETYIQGNPGTYHPYKLGDGAVYFTIVQTDGHYGIYPGSSTGAGFHRQSDANIVPWDANSDNSRWYFEEVTLSANEIEAQATAYREFMNASSTAESISETYLAFFTDASATVLKSEYQSMTDDELREAMIASAIPSGLQNEAVKVKNNSWDPWEKEFRVADYSIFSDADDWAGYMKTSQWGVINNPTGVVADNGDVVYVVVGDDIPGGTTLTLEARVYYTVGGGAEQTITLQKGLNALPVSNDASHIYVRYEINNGTVTKDNVASQPNIADFPALNIHVIGGNVHGYVNSTKHIDADWVDMRENGLFWAEQTDLLGKYSEVRLQTDFAAANGNSIIPLIDYYDWVVYNELELMGVIAVPEAYKNLPDANLAYADLYPKKVNNRLVCISKKNEGGNPYGAAYHMYVGGSGSFLYDNLKNKDGNSIWVFGHEWGHINQGAINIAASNEASNNLFANMLIHRGGTSTSRGWNVQWLQQKMADERSVNASGQYEAPFGVTNDNYVEKCGPYSWPRTVMSWDDIGKHFCPAQMFYQLYLYYHAAGHNPLFYPRLFNELRNDPLVQDTGKDYNYTTAGITASGFTGVACCTGEGDYLHFAKKCCVAANENLEDFFEAWGFFVPVENYFMECYGQWCMTTTQTQIDNALTYMREFGKANESIIFIDDRAVVSYQADGVTQKQPTVEFTLAACKTDFAGAQYSAFNGEPSQPNGLAYTTSTNSDGNTVVTINTDVTGVTNAAGVKFYDSDGNLVYFASQTSITIPANLKNTVDHSKTVISLTDGTTMPLYDSGAADVYEMTIHHGNGKTTTRYTKGADDAMLDGERDGKNAVAFVTDDNVPASISNATNVAVNNNFTHLSLADNADFHIGTDVSAVRKAVNGRSSTGGDLAAKKVTYNERKLYEGWNTLCLPFPITAAEICEGAEIGVLEKIEDDVLYFTKVADVSAGQPCLVKVPTDMDWLYNKEDVNGIAVTSTAQVIQKDTYYMNGGFTNEIIGAGHYKLNSAGTAFGRTTANGKNFPFRSYLSPTEESNVRTLRVMHREPDPTDITAPILDLQDGGVCYDLQGRKVANPKRGEIYILGGKKVIFK